MKIYNSLYKDFDDLFVGYSAVAIILTTCFGAAAAMVILMNGHDFIQMAQLFLVLVGTLTYLVSVLAQMKSKFVFNSLIFSLLLSSIILLINVSLRY
jgi:energy-coupling factor transporter transmembrane protein EcfT